MTKVLISIMFSLLFLFYFIDDTSIKNQQKVIIELKDDIHSLRTEVAEIQADNRIDLLEKYLNIELENIPNFRSEQQYQYVKISKKHASGDISYFNHASIQIPIGD